MTRQTNLYILATLVQRASEGQRDNNGEHHAYAFFLEKRQENCGTHPIATDQPRNVLTSHDRVIDVKSKLLITLLVRAVVSRTCYRLTRC